MSYRIEVDRLINMVSAMTGVELGVIDKNMIAIAGTGEYRKNIGTLRPKGSYGEKCINTGKTYILDEPRHGPHCYTCQGRSACPFSMAVYTPIRTGSSIEGTVFLLAYNKYHRDILTSNLTQFRDNLSTIAVLIANIIANKIQHNFDLNRLRYFEAAINDLESPIIIVNCEGKIAHVNCAAEALLNINSEAIENCQFDVIRKELGLKSDSNKGKKPGNFALFVSNPILFEGKQAGYVVHLKNSHNGVKYFQGSKNGVCDPFASIIGSGQKIKNVISTCRKFALSNSTILLRGETGTGKELIAKGIHNASSRSDKPFIIVNCGAIPENLLESEMFGYMAGAFTGANPEGKIGKFELADRGTIFLDEIGDMPIAIQPKLLRILEEGKIEKLGGTSSKKIDIRIIAATNRNLEQMISQGKFRNDLYYRLNVVPVELPSLRDRIEDMPELYDYFMNDYSKKSGLAPKKLTPEVKELFYKYSWPGNIRELRNLVEFIIQASIDEFIQINDLSKSIQNYHINSHAHDSPINVLDRVERNAIQDALDKYGSSVKGKRRAARFLGISLATLYRRIAFYNMN